MENIEKGMNLVLPIFFSLILVLFWANCAYDVISGKVSKDPNGLFAFFVFLMPFIFGILWIIGALVE